MALIKSGETIGLFEEALSSADQVVAENTAKLGAKHATTIIARSLVARISHKLKKPEALGLAEAILTEMEVCEQLGGHYIYFSVRRDEDNGSIIDFVQNRDRASIGVVRKELRPWIGAPPVPIPSLPPLVRSTQDRLRVEIEFAKMRDATRHPYLENERTIARWVLASERFGGRVRISDPHGNAIFPHFGADGLSGYEIKNKGFTGFSPGGCKALWLSQERASDHKLVFCESAIDALSLAALEPSEDTRFASIGGNPSPLQRELICDVIARMPLDAEIVSAMDADPDGAKLAEIIRDAVKRSGRDDLRFVIQEPFSHKDWNDQLRATSHKSKPPLPFRPQEPSVA